MISITPEIENCQAINVGCELKHSLWKLKGLAADIFFTSANGARCYQTLLDCSKAWKRIHIMAFKEDSVCQIF